MTIDTKKLTYDTFRMLPETKQRYEVLDGELIYMTPSPTPEHQRIALNLSLQLAPFVREHRLGEFFFAPLDVIIARDPLRTRQPDLLFVSNQRRGIIGPQQIEGGPDLIVEILSPSNTRVDVESKLQDYWAIEVQECWLISPEARTVEILQRGSSRFERLGLYGVDDLMTSRVLPDLHLSVEDIYQ
jgi:Uma2 family endonuclease